MAGTIRNAVIRTTRLGREDHGIFSYMIDLDYGDSSYQGFGGYMLDTHDPVTKARIGTRYGTEAIFKLLDVLEVSTWEKLPGTSCRVIHHDPWGRIQAIGHYLKDQWLDLDELAHQHRQQGDV